MAKSPDAFRTISEVAEWLDTPAHVLRFWESKFAQVKPVKRAGGRRYYRPTDMELLGGIKKLLHDDGMTIKGVQKVLSERGIKAVAALSAPVETNDAARSEDGGTEPDIQEDAGGFAVEAGDPGVDVPSAGLHEDAEPEPMEPPRVIPFTPAGATESGTESPGAFLDTAPKQPGKDAGGDTDLIANEAGSNDLAAPDTRTPEDALDVTPVPPHDPPAQAPDEAPIVEDVAVEPEDASPLDAAAQAPQAELFPDTAGPVPEFLSTPLAARLHGDDDVEAPGPGGALSAASPEGGSLEDHDIPEAEPIAASGEDSVADTSEMAPTSNAPWGDGSAHVRPGTQGTGTPAAEQSLSQSADPAPGEPDEQPAAATAEIEQALASRHEGALGDTASMSSGDLHEEPVAERLAPQDGMPLAEPGEAEGTLFHVSRLTRLTPEQAARIAPIAARLRAFVER